MKVTFIKTGKRVKPKENKKNNKAGFGEFFKTIFKKNQIIILTLALMLVTAGYLNYNNKADEENISIAELGDAKLVSTNVVEENQVNAVYETENNMDENIINNVVNNSIETNVEMNNDIQLNETKNEVKENDVIESGSNLQNTISSSEDAQNYFVQTRLERDMMYSQMLETYQKIVENDKIPADQKAIATNEIKNINDRKNAISIIENLIKTKGFKDAVILINDNNINVVVKQEKNLSEEQVAQITNIVSRELNAKIEDIHITVNK